jgi:GT2 family glycosyltransferase
MYKIGLGVVTYKRQSYFMETSKRIPLNAIDELVIVNDGTPYNSEIYPVGNNVKLIQNPTNLGVAKAKNKAIKSLLDSGCDHIFIMEDDIMINSTEVFQKYIDLSNETKIQHFNYALHGLANKKLDQVTPNPKQVVQYKEGKIALYQNCVGAFCYYSRKCLEQVGLIDEQFYNAFDHVDHTYQIIKNKMHPEFWWFADLANSSDYLSDIPWTPETSTISSRNDHQKLMRTALNLFESKNKVGIFDITNPDMNTVTKTLKEIYKNG